MLQTACSSGAGRCVVLAQRQAVCSSEAGQGGGRKERQRQQSQVEWCMKVLGHFKMLGHLMLGQRGAVAVKLPYLSLLLNVSAWAPAVLARVRLDVTGMMLLCAASGSAPPAQEALVRLLWRHIWEIQPVNHTQ